MKKYLTIILSLLICFEGLTQNMKKVLGTTSFCNIVFNYEFNQMPNGLYLFSIYRVPENANNANVHTFTLNDFKQEDFTQLCKNILTTNVSSVTPPCTDLASINRIATGVFYDIKTNLNLNDDEPVTAYLKLKSTSVKCYYSSNSRINSKSGDLKAIDASFLIDNVEIEFEDGVIKNLFADLMPVDNNGIPLLFSSVRFKNTIPISVSSRNDKDEFSNYNIYISDFAAFKNKFKLESSSNNASLLKFSATADISQSIGNKAQNICFILPDMIDYLEVLETDKEDYSPQNCVVRLNKANPIQKLTKIKRSKILTLKAFSDFVGVQKEQPNGLIQFEASRKFFLSTKKMGFKKIYFGYFNYIEPKVVFSKIEENNKHLILDESGIDKDFLPFNKKVFDVNPIEILKHQSFAFDLDLSFWKINLPTIKSNLQFKVSIGLGQLSTLDSINVINKILAKSDVPNISNLNFLRTGTSIMYEIKPDSRYGLTVGYDLRNYNILNENYYAFDSNFSNLGNSFWAEALLKVDTNSIIFFRHRFSFTSPIGNGNFVQVQLGYLVDLFKPSSK